MAGAVLENLWRGRDGNALRHAGSSGCLFAGFLSISAGGFEFDGGRSEYIADRDLSSVLRPEFAGSGGLGGGGVLLLGIGSVRSAARYSYSHLVFISCLGKRDRDIGFAGALRMGSGFVCF